MLSLKSDVLLKNCILTPCEFNTHTVIESGAHSETFNTHSSGKSKLAIATTKPSLVHAKNSELFDGGITDHRVPS